MSRGVALVAVIAACLISCEATGAPTPTPAASTGVATVPEGCSLPAVGGVLLGGYRTVEACVPHGRVLAIRCDAEATPLVVRGLSRRRSLVYLGGRFAVSVQRLPEGAVLLGVSASERIYGLDGQLYVEASGTVSRWLSLEPPEPASTRTPDASMIGDSILDGARFLLPDFLPRWTIALDAEIGRDSADGYPLVVSAIASAPEVVVIELGTNDEVPSQFTSNAETMLSALADVPLVLWVIPHGPASQVQAVGRAVREAVAAHPNAATADWDSFVPEDALADGVHLLPERQDVFPEFLAPFLGEWLAAVRGRGPLSCLDAVRTATRGT